MPTISDFLFKPTGGGVVGVFVQLTNNITGKTYVSTGATDATGKFTCTRVIPGTYSVATSPTGLAGTWGTPADTAYAVARVDPAINLADYCKGDGLTGDSANIQAALADSKAAGYIKIIVPPPPVFYLIDTPVLIDGSYSFEAQNWAQALGEGANPMLFRAKNALNDYMFKTDPVAFAANVTICCNFFGLEWDQNAAQQNAGGCVELKGTVHSHFERCHFYRAYDAWLHLAQFQNGNFGHHTKIVACLFDHTDASANVTPRGLWFDNCDENFVEFSDFEYTKGRAVDDGSGLNVMRNSTIVNFIGIGYYGEAGKPDSTLEGNIFDSGVVVGGSAVNVGGERWLLVGNYFYLTGGDQVSFGGGGTGGKSQVIANRFYSNGTNGVTSSFINENGNPGFSQGLNLIEGNYFTIFGTISAAKIVPVGAGPSTYIGNRGFVDRNSGQVNAGSGTDVQMNVNHGMDLTPNPNMVSVIPLGPLNGASVIYLASTTATQLVFIVKGTSTSTVSCGWGARLS